LRELELRRQQIDNLRPRPQESADLGPCDVEAGDEWDRRKREAELDLKCTLE